MKNWTKWLYEKSKHLCHMKNWKKIKDHLVKPGRKKQRPYEKQNFKNYGSKIASTRKFGLMKNILIKNYGSKIASTRIQAI